MGTAARPTSRLLYLSKAVKAEWPHRATRYQNMSSGRCGGCRRPSVNLACTHSDNEVHCRTLAACGGVVKGRVEGASVGEGG